MDHWQSEKTSLIARTSFVLNNELFSDVKFSVGPASVEYHAHKLLLCLASPVFEQRFSNHVSDVLTTVRVPDIVPDAFYKMLQYIYTDTIALEDITDAHNVLAAAQKFKIEHLENECKRYIEERHISPDIVCKMYEIATELHMEEVRNLCQYTFVKHTKSVLKSAGFLQAKLATVETVIQNDSLSTDEITIMEAVIKWGEAQCAKKGITVNGSNVRFCIDPLVKYLRFLTLSLEEFHKFLSVNDILTRNEVFTITMKLSQPCDNICVKYPSSLCVSSCKRNQTFVPSVKKADKKFDNELLNLSSLKKAGNKFDNELLNLSSLKKADKKLNNELLNLPSLKKADKKFDNELLQLKDLKSETNNFSFVSEKSAMKLVESCHEFSVEKHLHKNVEVSHANAVGNIPIELVTSTSESSSSSSSENDTDEFEVVSSSCNGDGECRACEIRLDKSIENPNWLKVVDVSSEVKIEMQRGKINILGFHVQVEKLPNVSKECVPVIVNIVKGSESFEEVHNTDIHENIRLEKNLFVMPNESCSITVLIENLQLQRCGMCKLREFVMVDGNVRFSVILRGNQKIYNNELPFLISHIVYNHC